MYSHSFDASVTVMLKCDWIGDGFGADEGKPHLGERRIRVTLFRHPPHYDGHIRGGCTPW